MEPIFCFVVSQRRRDRGSNVTAPSSTHGDYGRTKLLAGVLEIADAACKQTCASSDRDGANLFFEGKAGRIKEHEICHEKFDALLGKVEPDATEGDVSVFACGEATGRGNETEDFTVLDVTEQSVLLDCIGEICENDVVHALYAAVVR